MAPSFVAAHDRQGKLADNVMHFGRLLRAAGVPVGPDRVLDALHALEHLCASTPSGAGDSAMPADIGSGRTGGVPSVRGPLELSGLGRRDDFYWTLAAVFLDRHDRLPLFDQAFHMFWRDPELALRVSRLPQVQGRLPPRTREPEISQRLVQALLRQREASAPPLERVTFDASLTFSARETLQTMDFESMSREELAAARAVLARFRLRLPEARTRRYAPDARGERIDPRASLRASLRLGGAIIPLRRRSAVKRAPPVVALCDVSGSMSRYTRMFLHFLHATVNDRSRVHALTFGTRLTSITRHLQYRDSDVALAKVSRSVRDWSGGTRIGACLKEFNTRWSRRLLGQGAVVLLISDGLDCDAGADLALQMERLRKSCRRLIWLNPLLRYEAFEARPAGIQAMLPYVDEFLPAHNVQSLADLARILATETHGNTRKQRSGTPESTTAELDSGRHRVG